MRSRLVALLAAGSLLAVEPDPAVVPTTVIEQQPLPVCEPLPRSADEDRVAVRRLVVTAARLVAEGDQPALAALATPDALLPAAPLAGLVLIPEGEPRLDGDHAAWGGAAQAGTASGRWYGSAVHTGEGWRLTRLAVVMDAEAVPTAIPAPPWGWLAGGAVLGLALGAAAGVLLARRR